MAGWYGQINYSDPLGARADGSPGKYTIASAGCFVTAFCNLLRKFGKEVDPASLNRLFIQRHIYIDLEDGVFDELGWASITAYDGSIHVAQVNNNAQGSWPTSNNSIVKFHYTNKAGQEIDHLCLVADEAAHTIVDSYDGNIKTSPYGQPVAWAMYEGMEAVPATPLPITPAGATYTVSAGETLSGIAAKYGTDYHTLADLNGIADPNLIKPGEVLRLPVNTTSAVPPADVTAVRYEILPAVKQMHIAKTGGAEKWAFANIKDWKDFISSGHFAENTNVEVVAIAHVPVGKETAAYYMDKLALGDYVTTGRVANTVGFNWSDMADGFITDPVPAAPAPTPINDDTYTVVKGDTLSEIAARAGTTYQVLALLNGITNPNLIFPGQVIQLKAPAPTPAPAPAVAVAAPVPQVKVSDIVAPTSQPNAWKGTQQALPAAEFFVARSTLMVKELDGRRPDRQLVANTSVQIVSTFTKDGVLYCRPLKSAQNGLWFGIPRDELIPETEMFSTNLSVDERRDLHKLTPGEKLFDGLLAIGKFLIGPLSKIKIKK